MHLRFLQVLAQSIDNVKCSCDKEQRISISSKGSISEWTFNLQTSGRLLQNVSLLSDTGVQNNFSLTSIKQTLANQDGEVQEQTFEPDSQEWYLPNSLEKAPENVGYFVKVSFEAEIFGTFQQTIIFSFGTEPYLRKDILVDVKPLDGDEEMKLQNLQDTLIKQTERWSKSNCIMKDFDPPVHIPPDEDKYLYQRYPMPQPNSFKPTKNVIEPSLTKQNYKSRMHELLYIEEMAQFEQVSQFNVKTTLSLISNYLLDPSSTNSSSAKFARPGELFGKMTLKGSLSEDTTAGRLILTNCTSMLLKGKDPNIAYVSAIEDSGKSILYLRLSQALVSELTLKHDEEVELEVQFQLNRLPLCEMHLALDKLPDIHLIYPNVHMPVSIPWSPGKHWAEDMHPGLNGKQREAILAMTSPLTVLLPPILLIGPYGTGKTFTLAQSIMMLLKQKGNKILICTHSNSAADLYIRDYLDPFIGHNPHIKLLRIYYKNRWVQTVHKSVQKYCLIDQARCFINPSREDVINCNIVVATLSTSRLLSTVGLPVGLFTHIFIDEAAQAMECEAIMPLALAHAGSTRIVLAGDHMQLSPEVFSSFALERKFNKSLLERLYNLYPNDYSCKIHLTENYRSHEAIINYTSEIFYEQKLLASGKQTKHEKWHPLTFFTARGEDIQDKNSTSFYNNAEVYEVIERVDELQKTWPKHWGHRGENSIGIVTPYYDQVQRIRSELKKKKLFGVSVERVLNVQGKQFRAIFLSTVRTRRTCVLHNEDVDTDFGFLSNPKLLNTAITRAQSLVAVIGDPVALCSIGKCRRLWERFIDTSNKNSSLFGTPWDNLLLMLKQCELGKPYVLNPLAPEFIPRAARTENYLRQMLTIQQQEMHKNMAMNPPPMQGSFAGHNLTQFFRHMVPPPLPPPYPFLPPGLQNFMYNPPLYFPPQNNFMQPPPLPTAMRPPTPQNFIRPSLASSPQKSVTPMNISGIRMTPLLPPLPRPEMNAQNPSLHPNLRPVSRMPVRTSVPSNDMDYALLKDRIHIPPVPKTAPPPKPLHEQRQSSDPMIDSRKLLIEAAIDLLPTNSNFDSFLESVELQMSWFVLLKQSKGEKEANLFKEAIVVMQQHPEILKEIKQRLQMKKAQSATKKTQPIANPAQFPSPLSNDYRNSPTSSNILMPSASSADPFYTFANAATRQQLQNNADDILKDIGASFSPKEHVTKEVWNDTSSNSDGGWGSMNSMLHHESTESLAPSNSPSVPLYKRKAGSSNMQPNAENSFHFGELSNSRVDPQPWFELATRSSTMPSSSLSTIWSNNRQTNQLQQQNNGGNRTYANVLRQQDDGGPTDPLEKIRQIGTRGSQELFESSTSPNSTFQQPFSPFNGKW